ncbi:MAG: transposase [Nocardioides sp.]|uniref:IS3 family transposase n=1 Tax=Nocardioides sp. TaxID=35761 RepID=UPI002607014C|nr:IS3 family transposase [Nocardioides sp.]MCW2835289.1 transposase [Nocardioides sp.]
MASDARGRVEVPKNASSSCAEYMDWFNHRRLHGEIGLVPPVEFEEQHYRHNPVATTVAASVQSLY